MHFIQSVDLSRKTQSWKHWHFWTTSNKNNLERVESWNQFQCKLSFAMMSYWSHWYLCMYLPYFQIQECIPGGCVLPAHWPYLIVSAMHAPLPCMTPTMHTPCHAGPPATHVPPAMYAPRYACPLAMQAPLLHMPPAMHAPCHACPLPCMPPSATHAPHHAHPLPVDRILDTRFCCGR